MTGVKKSFSFTHVEYDENDGLLGIVLAFSSLLPVFYTVSLATHSVFGRDLRVLFVLIGSTLTFVLCTILKNIIQQPRPIHHNDNHDSSIINPLLHLPESQKHGMPSNHSSFMTFCATFSILFAIRRCRNMQGPSVIVKQTKRFLVPVICIATALCCSYSRIHLGYHTMAQVLVGVMLGCIMGILWYILYEQYYITQWAPALEEILSDWDFRSSHDSDDVGYVVKRSLDARRKINSQRKNGWKRE